MDLLKIVSNTKKGEVIRSVGERESSSALCQLILERTGSRDRSDSLTLEGGKYNDCVTLVA